MAVYKEKNSTKLNIWEIFPQLLCYDLVTECKGGMYEYTVYQPFKWSFYFKHIIGAAYAGAVSELTGIINRQV